MLTKDLAICIRAIDYSETSQIVTLFARSTGKIDVIAKGSKRPKSPFDGPIEVLSHGNIVFVDPVGEKLATLTEFQQQPTLINLRNNLFVLNTCLFAAELLNKLTHDYDPHPELLESFLDFLKNVNKQTTTIDQKRNVMGLLILFQLILLNEIGLKPILSHCVNCKTRYQIRDTRYEYYFSSPANGLICRDCESSFPDKIRLSNDASDCLTALKKIPDSAEKTLEEIEKVLIQHLTGLLGRTPKMAKHILETDIS